MTTTSQVVLIGRNSIVREGLRRLLSEQDRQIIYSGASLDELRIIDVAVGEFLLLLIEDSRSEWDGNALASVHQRHPAARMAILAKEFDFHAMLEAFRAGAEGYVTNDVSWERLIGYLDLVSLGEKIFPSQLAQKLLEESSVCEDVPDAASVDSANLSGREMEILLRLIAGLPNKVISRQLSISEATVKVHVKAVLRKLRVANRTQAAIWAATQGLQGVDSSVPPSSLSTTSCGRGATSADVIPLQPGVGAPAAAIGGERWAASA